MGMRCRVRQWYAPVTNKDCSPLFRIDRSSTRRSGSLGGRGGGTRALRARSPQLVRAEAIATSLSSGEYRGGSDGAEQSIRLVTKCEQPDDTVQARDGVPGPGYRGHARGMGGAHAHLAYPQCRDLL